MKTASEEPRLCEERGTCQSIRDRPRARWLSYVRGVGRHKAWCPQEQEKPLARACLRWCAPQHLTAWLPQWEVVRKIGNRQIDSLYSCPDELHKEDYKAGASRSLSLSAIRTLDIAPGGGVSQGSPHAVTLGWLAFSGWVSSYGLHLPLTM